MSSVSVVTSINLPFDRKSKRAFVFPVYLDFAVQRYEAPKKMKKEKKIEETGTETQNTHANICAGPLLLMKRNAGCRPAPAR